MTSDEFYWEDARGPYHDFWLVGESDRAYNDYKDLLNRRSPVRLCDDILMYFYKTVLWIPTVNPTGNHSSLGYGLNYYGVTIINRLGADLFRHVFEFWAYLFAQSSDPLVIDGGSIGIIGDDNLRHEKKRKIRIDRVTLVETLTMLAYYGEQAVTGEFYILHLGI